MFNVKAINTFDQQIIDRIIQLFRSGGLIPSLNDKSIQARDFEPDARLKRRFDTIRKNCHDLCHGVGTPTAWGMICRYLDLSMTLAGEYVHRSLEQFLSVIDEQIGTGTNRDRQDSQFPPFVPYGNLQMPPVNGLGQLFQLAPRNHAPDVYDRELLNLIGLAIKDFYALNHVLINDNEIGMRAWNAIQAGAKTQLEGLILTYMSLTTSQQQNVKFSPDEGSGLNYVQACIVEHGIRVEPHTPIVADHVVDASQRLMLDMVEDRTYKREEVLDLLMHDQKRTMGARIQHIVQRLLEQDGVDNLLIATCGSLMARELINKYLASAVGQDRIIWLWEVKRDLAEMRSQISHHDGGTLDLLSREAPIRQLGDVEVSMESNAMGDEPADSALLADSALMLAGFEPTKPELVNPRKVELEGYHFEREDDFHVITREYGVSPQGNALQGAWVCRNYHTGEYIDHDRYRADLFERLNVSRLNDV